MMTYSIMFQNNSSNAGSACVFQGDPNTGFPGIMSLAWFAKYAYPTTMILFKWTTEYDFVWSETGKLAPGILFTSSQIWPADLTGKNKVTLTHQGGAYTFTNQTKGPQQGSLYITEDQTIPLNMASVGIGMSGSGTFVVQAQPNMNAIFTFHPEYWITFGNFKEGEVLDITQITNKAQITFPPNIYSMAAILNQDNTWTIKPTSQVNAEFLEAKKRNSKIKWGMS